MVGGINRAASKCSALKKTVGAQQLASTLLKLAEMLEERQSAFENVRARCLDFLRSVMSDAALKCMRDGDGTLLVDMFTSGLEQIIHRIPAEPTLASDVVRCLGVQTKPVQSGDRPSFNLFRDHATEVQHLQIRLVCELAE